MSLKGKNVIITGANRGIGLAMLTAFAKEECNIWACARKQSDSFERAIQQIALDNNVWIKPIYFSLDSDDSISAGIKEILSEDKIIDVVVNNAGVTQTSLLMQTPMKKIRDVFQVNYFAPVSIIRELSKRLVRQKSGCIINMASVAGIDHQPGRIAYGSSKAALIWATKSLAKELGPFNIRVNGVAPGAIKTEMIADYSEAKINGIIQETALRRLGGVDDVTKAALFLASDESSFISGQILIVDGGRI